MSPEIARARSSNARALLTIGDWLREMLRDLGSFPRDDRDHRPRASEHRARCLAQSGTTFATSRANATQFVLDLRSFASESAKIAPNLRSFVPESRSFARDDHDHRARSVLTRSRVIAQSRADIVYVVGVCSSVRRGLRSIVHD
jgi:hypothetical protein